MTAASEKIVTPANGCIGILGGGQLGRMLAVAASNLGLKTCILAPEKNSPAFDVAAFSICADYDDGDALSAFAQAADVVTYEFENVPVDTVVSLEARGALVMPGARALAAAQDRLIEKQFIESLGAEVAPYHAVETLEDLETGLSRIGAPAILKTRRLGYDGKGQTRIKSPGGHGPDALSNTWEAAKQKAWEEIGARPSILEGFIDFSCEISIIGARGQDGQIALYDAAENHHENGILRRSAAPASAPTDSIAAAQDITAKLLSTLEYVGVVGVEFFVKKDGDVIVNEFAPRVHNSGHWTLDACPTSQFEQHIRAVAGWPLGSPERALDAQMLNILGEEATGWEGRDLEPGARLHLYGKSEVKAGRKMGHLTKVGQRKA